MMREKVSLDNEVCKDLMEQNDVRVMSQESIIRARYDEWNNLYTQPSQSVNFHSFFRKARSRCFRSCSSPSRFFHTLIGFVPIVSVLSTYSIRRFLLNDIVGGFTVGVMHVPQGIAYAVLSGVPPVYGLYASFFPGLIYMLFGTSKHCSVGSFAVIALMSGLANERIRSAIASHSSSLPTDLSNSTTSYEMKPIEVATALTFTVGVAQFMAGFLHLEFVTTYFSDQMVSGFTTGASTHVVVAQLDKVLGIKVPSAKGPGYLFMRVYDIAARIPQTNLCTLIISLCGGIFLYVGKEVISPFVNKKTGMKITIPYELMLMIISTLASYFLSLHSHYNVPIVGTMHPGLPSPKVPHIEVVSYCITDAIVIAAVALAVHISLAKMLAKKMNYPINARQEMLALGITEIGTSFFPVYPTATGIGRTIVNTESGSKTQISSLFAGLFLLAVILFLGPFLEPLPMDREENHLYNKIYPSFSFIGSD